MGSPPQSMIDDVVKNEKALISAREAVFKELERSRRMGTELTLTIELRSGPSIEDTSKLTWWWVLLYSNSDIEIAISPQNFKTRQGAAKAAARVKERMWVF